MRTRRVPLGLSSRGVGYPAVVWLSKLWGDLLVSGSSKGKTPKESGHTSRASIEPAASPVDTPPSFPHGPGTFTVPITRRRRFSIFVVLSIIALIVAGGVVVVIRAVVIGERRCW